MIQRGAYGPTALLIQSAQPVTAEWADLGLLIDTRGFRAVAIWLNIEMNGSSGLRLRCIARHSAASTDNYLLPIASVSAGEVTLQDEYFEFADNVDQKMIVSCDIDNIIPHCQFQVMAGNLSTPAAIVTSAYYSTGY